MALERLVLCSLFRPPRIQNLCHKYPKGIVFYYLPLRDLSTLTWHQPLVNWLKLKATSIRIRLFLKNGDFFFQFNLLFTHKRCLRRWAPKTRVFKTVLGVGIFENAGLSFTIKRTKTEDLGKDFVIYHILLVLRMFCKGCYRTILLPAF